MLKLVVPSRMRQLLDKTYPGTFELPGCYARRQDSRRPGSKHYSCRMLLHETVCRAQRGSVEGAPKTAGSLTQGTSDDEAPWRSPKLLVQQGTAMFAGSAVLGPLCDGQHSSHDVLHYVNPVHVALEPLLSLETCWWVPILFGVAGIILGVSHPLLDRTTVATEPVLGREPAWTAVFLGNALFVMQYAASGALEAPLARKAMPGGLPLLDALLATTAALHWAAFDRSRQGLGMAVLTAIAGPVVEIALINGFGLYHYEHPQILGIPTWIPWVYFCGAPAVGNLGRRVMFELLQDEEADMQL